MLLVLLSVSAVLCSIAIIFLIWPSSTRTSVFAVVVTPTGQVITADIANTPSARAKGLSGRASLAPDQGMLFLFDRPSIPTFWMPNMKFAIDIVWLNGNRVISVSEGVQPESGVPVLRYSPDAPVNRVLEVPEGVAAASGMVAGAELDIQLPSE